MEIHGFIALLRKKWTVVFISVVLFVVFAAVFTFIEPLKYSATSRLLITQISQDGVDPYVAMKSNEYLSDVLTKIVNSTSFYDEVSKAGFNINEDYFSGELSNQMKIWNSTVYAKALGNSGIIEINVFHPDKYQADQIAQAVDYILKNKNNLFQSSGDKINVKIIDKPSLSEWPVKPNVGLNFSLALVIGLIFGALYLHLFHQNGGQTISRQSIREDISFKVDNQLSDRYDINAGNTYVQDRNQFTPQEHSNNGAKPFVSKTEPVVFEGNIENIFRR